MRIEKNPYFTPFFKFLFNRRLNENQITTDSSKFELRLNAIAAFVTIENEFNSKSTINLP